MSNPPITWSQAQVHARDQVVRYRRSGAGRPVLLLQTEPLWPEVHELLLEPGVRLFVPDPPEPGAEVETWLAALLDGLGMPNLVVIACDGFCIAALERALLEPDQVDRIILVCQGRGRESGVDGTLTSRLAAVPLLVLRRDRPADEILPLVRSFIA
jgi:hypothetical protein